MGSIQSAVPLIFLVVIILCSNSNLIAAQTLSWKTPPVSSGTNLLQINNASDPMSQSDDTVRVDPLDNFKKYRGGYNITNKHYWSSTVFTGVSGYVLGVLWLLCGIAYGVFLLSNALCCKNRRKEKLEKKTSPPCHKQCYLWPILVAILFTILAVLGSGLVLGGNAEFRSQARTVVNIIINTANDASVTIYNATGAMKDMRDSLGATNQSSSETFSFLTSTSARLDKEAADIQRQTRKNRRLIDKGLKIVYILTTVLISLNLTAVIALSACGTLKLQRALNWLVALCWFLTVLCWLFFGLYFFLGKFAGDTCTALENFQENPNNNSLSSIIPCDELLSAKPVLTEVSAGIYNLVNQVNANISVIQVCNPFSGPPEYQYQPNNCSSNAIKIGDIPQVLEPFICSGSSPTSGTCISASDYQTVKSYTTSIQNLLNVYPQMESLVECQPVKDAFSFILSEHCKPLKKYVRMVWASMAFLSVCLVFLVLIWTMQARHEKERHALDGSVKPYSASASKLESGAAEATKDDSAIKAQKYTSQSSKDVAPISRDNAAKHTGRLCAS